MPAPHIIPIESTDDPRIAPYTRLKQRDLAREGGRFIAEGELVVRRLLASSYAVESLLLSTARVNEIAPLAPENATIYAAPPDLVNRIVGFKFHSGVMAVGLRGQPQTLSGISQFRPPGPLLLVILPEIASTDNLGSLIRISSAFGVNAIILGERSCDPYYRQSIRVSMGAVFSIPIVRSTGLLRDLHVLRQTNSIELAAAVLDETATPLAAFRRPPRLGILFGNEAQGLRPDEISASDHRITVPMKLGTDSLNVSVAAAVFLYHLTQVTVTP